MNKFKIIIQRTLNGLEVDYKSEPIHEHELEESHILYDERKEINQLDAGFAYCVTNTDQYKVYSYINNRISDVSKRKGFYAVRLLMPRHTKLRNVLSTLEEIAKRYEQHYDRGDINSLDYSDVINQLHEQVLPISKLLSPSINPTVCYVFLDFNTEAEQAFTNSILDFFRKTYLLDNNDKNSSSLLSEIGMKDLKSIAKVTRSVFIEDAEHLLTGLWVKDTPISLSNSNIRTERIELVCLENDSIYYTSQLKPKKTLLTDSQLTLHSPHRSHSSSQRHSSRLSRSTLYWVALCALLAGGGIGYFGAPYLQNTEKTIIPMLPMLNEESSKDNIFNLKIDAANSQAFLVASDSVEIKDYYFKHEPQGPTWKFRKRSDKSAQDRELSKIEILKMFGDDESRAEQLIKELQEYANTPVKDSLASPLTTSSQKPNASKASNRPIEKTDSSAVNKEAEKPETSGTAAVNR